MPNDDADHANFLTIGFAGMMTGAFAEALGEMAKELRRYAGCGFDKCLDDLERRALRSVENAAIDGISENDQLFLIEKTRGAVAATFKDIRCSS